MTGMDSLRAKHPREQGLKLGTTEATTRGLSLRAKHPREQGLKLGNGVYIAGGTMLRAKHPREQGLKRQDRTRFGAAAWITSSETSTRTRIETLYNTS